MAPSTETGAGAPGDIAFAPIPEPGTVGLLAFGLAAVALTRKKGFAMMG